MNKRKIDINNVKKMCVKGRVSSKSAKYYTVFSYFKMKDPQAKDIFRIRFPALAKDLLEAAISYDALTCLQSDQLPNSMSADSSEVVLLETFQLRELSGEFPTKYIMDCLFIGHSFDEKTKKKQIILGICDHKLIMFLKKLRDSYSDFCIGYKVLLEQSDFLTFYEAYKSYWTKRYEKGRDTDIQKLEKRIIRCLLIFTALIENSILVAIDYREKQEKAKEEMYNLEFGTKSYKKKNSKTRYQHSTCSKNSTYLISNFSIKPMSQKSNEDLLLGMEKIDHSQKSMKIVSKPTYYEGILDKADIRRVTCPIDTDPIVEFYDYMAPGFINLLGDGIYNVLISYAFRLGNKLSRFDEASKAFNLTLPNQVFLPNHMYGYSQGYIPIPVNMQMPFQFDTSRYFEYVDELHQLRRSVDMFPAFTFHNQDTMSLKSRQSQGNRLISRNNYRSNK